MTREELIAKHADLIARECDGDADYFIHDHATECQCGCGDWAAHDISGQPEFEALFEEMPNGFWLWDHVDAIGAVTPAGRLYNSGRAA